MLFPFGFCSSAYAHSTGHVGGESAMVFFAYPTHLKHMGHVHQSSQAKKLQVWKKTQTWNDLREYSPLSSPNCMGQKITILKVARPTAPKTSVAKSWNWTWDAAEDTTSNQLDTWNNSFGSPLSAAKKKIEKEFVSTCQVTRSVGVPSLLRASKSSGFHILLDLSSVLSSSSHYL